MPAYAAPRGFAVAVPLLGAYTVPRGFAVPVRLAPAGDLPAANDDTYETGKHFPLTVVAPGVLSNDTDPAGLGLTAHLATSAAHGALTFDDDGSFHYVPDASFIGADTFTYYVRDGAGTDSAAATVTINVSLLPTTRYEQIGASAPWSRAPLRMRSVALGFSVARRLGVTTAMPFGRAQPMARATELPWSRAPQVDRSSGLPWQRSDVTIERSTGLPSVKAPIRQTGGTLPWSQPPALRTSVGMRFDKPPALRRTFGLPWGRPPAVRTSAGAPWLKPPPLRKHWLLPWGRARVVQWQVHGNDVTPPPPEPPVPQFNPGRGFAIAVPIACPLPPLRGFSIPVPIGPAACYFARARPRSYIVLNTATVIAIATSREIAVSSISLSESIDDLHHAFDLTLADPADLAWLKPTSLDPSPIAVQININGHVRTGIVEAWATDTEFPAPTVRVSGRARTALLDVPYAPARAYVEASERTSQQLVDQELDSTAYTADYDLVDWTVPAGVWHYGGLTPAAAIRRIAEAAGGIARAHPWDTVLELIPRYPVSPWDWDTTAADKEIDDDYVPKLTESGSTSGTPTYEVRLPLWPTSDTSKPGLLRPGQLVSFAAADGWKAQVASVRITATAQQAGGATALIVWQDVTLEAPPAEPSYDYVLVSGDQTGVADPVIRDGTAGNNRLPQIVDALITEHAVARERGRNALAGGGDGRALTNLWAQLVGLTPQGRYIKGNVSTVNGDGSYSIATTDGSTIRARALPGQSWDVLDGVFVQDGRIVDSAPSLPGTTQTV